jgi:hypothetical protein
MSSDHDNISVGFGIISNSSSLAPTADLQQESIQRWSSNSLQLPRVVQSIRELNIPKYKICICDAGTPTIDMTGITHIKWDEERYPHKIGLKKNANNKELDTDIVVHLHDYMVFDRDWWEGYKEFGFDWDICVNKLYETDFPGHRGEWVRNRDWWRSSQRKASIKVNEEAGYEKIANCSLIDYDDYSQLHYQYIPGNFWVSKRHVIEEEPISDRPAGAMEDVEWSERVIPKYTFKVNPLSTVRSYRGVRSCTRWSDL